MAHGFTKHIPTSSAKQNLAEKPVLLSLSVCSSSSSSSSTLDVLKKIGLLYSATGSGHRILIGFHLDRFTQSWMYCWLLREFGLKDWIAPLRPQAASACRAAQSWSNNILLWVVRFSQIHCDESFSICAPPALFVKVFTSFPPSFNQTK